MKKIVSLVLVLIMVLSFSSIALAASPTGGTTTGGTTAGGAPAKVVEVKGASAEGKAALEAAVTEELKGKLAEGESTEVVASFSCAEKGRIVANAAGVKAGDTIYVLFRGADGKVKLLKAVAKDGQIAFTAPGAGDFMIVRVIPVGGAATVPSTGDSNRLMKLVLVGVAAISVMTLAGVAIKRSNI